MKHICYTRDANCQETDENSLCGLVEKKNTIKKTKIVSLVPEPAYVILPASDKLLCLNIQAQSMYNTIEYDNTDIVFRDTLLFQVRNVFQNILQ